MDEVKFAQLMASKQAAREQAMVEVREKAPHLAPLLNLGEIDAAAIAAHEHWLPAPHDFGWERIPKWKYRQIHREGLDMALWHGSQLAGMCWASPLDSKTRIMVLYLQRNPDDKLATKGFVAPICLSAVRCYALILGLKWVVIKDPLPQARAAYGLAGFRTIKGIGLACAVTPE